MIASGDDQAYCLKQCYKMCYYVQKMHNHEILKMRAEFTKDDNGTIWFTYASRIHSREIISNDEQKVRTKKITYINKEHQALLI